MDHGTRTRTNTNPNGTEANAAGRSGNARALRKQSKCRIIQEGEGRGVVAHLSDHNPVMVAQVDYYIRANHSINGKGKLRYLTKLFIL